MGFSKLLLTLSPLLALPFAAACGGGDSDEEPPPPVAMGGMPMNDVYDESRAIQSCQNACGPYSEACGETCDDACDDGTRLTSAERCPGEFYDYYDCVAAAAASDFDCDAGDTVMDNPVASCADDWLAYAQCRRTRGELCVLLSSNAAVCANTSADTPNWGTCKVGVDPPSGCVAIDATDYCCPPN